MISSKYIAKALYQLSQESTPAEQIISALFWYLEKNHLSSLLPKILEQLENFSTKEKDFETLDITSGLPLEDTTITEIKSYLQTDSSSKIKKKTDESLIGGFIATYRGYIYDASLKRQINLLKATLKEY